MRSKIKIKVDIETLNQIKESLSAEEISEYWQIRLFKKYNKSIRTAEMYLFKIKLTWLNMKYIMKKKKR